MAARKPKGIADDIVGGIRKIVSPWLGAPPAQNKQVTQAQGLARAAAETLDQTFAGGLVKAGVQGNQALVKQAAVNAAALGAGYIAGKAAVTAAGAVAKTGVPARIVNKLTGQSVVVHASGTARLPQIDPRLGSQALPYDKAAFAWNPAAYKQKDSIRNMLFDSQTYRNTAPLGRTPEPTVYIAKTPTKNLQKIRDTTPTPGPSVDSYLLNKIKGFKESGMVTNKSLKVVDSMDFSKFQDTAARATELAQKIRKAGGKVPKGSTKRRSYIVDEDF
jgi:hypothetical protein